MPGVFRGASLPSFLGGGDRKMIGDMITNDTSMASLIALAVACIMPFMVAMLIRSFI